LVRHGHLPERENMTGIECVVGECATVLVEAASASGGERARGSAETRINPEGLKALRQLALDTDTTRPSPYDRGGQRSVAQEPSAAGGATPIFRSSMAWA
jgi:hypothetical protein